MKNSLLQTMKSIMIFLINKKGPLSQKMLQQLLPL
nr:MAG TPA_asm: hypothetical protein [Bacteriophage sp.]